MEGRRTFMPGCGGWFENQIRCVRLSRMPTFTMPIIQRPAWTTTRLNLARRRGQGVFD